MVAGAAAVAGGDPGTALRLGISMTALQASIGTLNDLVDAPTDQGRKPGKPIPAGVVTPGLARVVVLAAAGLGVLLALPGWPGLVALALSVLAIGYGYDRYAKGTAWSWLPFAVGIPLLPAYGWYGATGSLAAWFAALLPLAAVAGTALAIGNARVDVERDRDAGTRTVATALGLERSWWVLVGLWCGLGAAALAALVFLDAASSGSTSLVVLGLVVVLVGTAIGRHGDPVQRERSWEVQAIGAAVGAVGWIIAVA